MTGRSHVAFLAVFLGAWASLGASPAPGRSLPPGSRPRILSYEVTSPAGEKGWINCEVEVAADFPGSTEDFLAVLRDYGDYSRVFSTIASATPLSEAGGLARYEQRNILRVLGLEYATTLVFVSELKDEGGGRARLYFRMVESDGSTRHSDGYWELEESPTAQGPMVSLHYSCHLVVAARFPGQARIMRNFGKATFENMVTEVGEAVLRQGR